MLKYAVILLSDESISYCSYENSRSSSIISAEVLDLSVLWAIKENLEIQFVFPNHPLSQDLLEIIESVSHTNIMGINNPYVSKADIIIIDGLVELGYVQWAKPVSYILRLDSRELEQAIDIITTSTVVPNRINFVIKDRISFDKENIVQYEESLNRLAIFMVEKAMATNKLMQCNLLTDRLFLDSMNNCEAGYESITIAPNGCFYICPAFYYAHEDCCGDIKSGISILNKQLYRLDHAPICMHCDAYQCMRCIWMNIKSTLEVNTPSQGQCYSAHIERRVSRSILKSLRENGLFIDGVVPDIPSLDYIDPFDNRHNWK